MKIRKGFVSNSSASSFIVEIKDWLDQSQRIKITDKQQRLLFEYGFATYNDEDQLEYEVSCNEDEVIVFLLENKISFIATLHYNHWGMIYNAEKDLILVGKNFGEEFATYHRDAEFYEGEISLLNKVKPFYQMKASEFYEKKLYYGNPDWHEPDQGNLNENS